MKIMSFNLRYDNSADGINAFPNRIPRIIEIIERESPDIIGFQEVTDSMKKTIRSILKEYTTVGCGRDSNYHGESMLVGFKTELFELIEVNSVWLSETPSVPGSKYGLDHSSCPRMFTSVLLKHNDIESPIRFINTHLDHVGALARVKEAEQLSNYLLSLKEPFVLTGDFNATPETPEIELIRSKIHTVGGIDCTENLGPTFHEFGKRAEDRQIKIDYIFSNLECKNVYKVEDIPVNGQYYSDHNAICAQFEL